MAIDLNSIKEKLQYVIDHYKEIPDSLFMYALDGEWTSQKEDKGKDPNLNFVWIYDMYRSGNYEGEGERIGIRKSDGQLTYGYTSHCSCNSPWESEGEYGKFLEHLKEENYEVKKKFSDQNILPSYKETDIAVDMVVEVWGPDSQKIVQNIEKLYDIVKNGASTEGYDPHVERDDY